MIICLNNNQTTNENFLVTCQRFFGFVKDFPLEKKRKIKIMKNDFLFFGATKLDEIRTE